MTRSAVAPAASPPTARRRLTSLDAVRGFAIVVMFVVANPGTVAEMPTQLKHHAGATGFTFSDSIFPLFLFAVGTAMLFSSRLGDGRRVVRRASILFGLGVVLASLRAWDLVISWGVLQRIAVAYVLAWLVLRLPVVWRWTVVLGIVGGATALFAAFPPTEHAGFWGTGGGLVSLADGRFRLGFSLLATVGTLLSVVLVLGGAVAGRLLKDRGDDTRGVIAVLVAAAAACAGLAFAMSALVPISQRSWSPSFTVLSLGTAFAYLAVFHAVSAVRVMNPVSWTFVVPGMNAIAAYVACFGVRDLFLQDHIRPPIVSWLTGAGGAPFAALSYALAVGVMWWLFCLVLYRRRIFLRI